jgi:DNA-binding PadR family transcriptional regulator
MPQTPKNELLKGTLDMLVLKTLSVQPMHGYGIAQQIEALSEDALRVEQGWRARYYSITAAGRRQLGDQISSFDAMLVAINRVLRRA